VWKAVLQLEGEGIMYFESLNIMPLLVGIFLAFLAEEKIITWKLALVLFLLQAVKINLHDVSICGGVK
jgi:hypothetical protein